MPVKINSAISGWKLARLDPVIDGHITEKRAGRKSVTKRDDAVGWLSRFSVSSCGKERIF